MSLSIIERETINWDSEYYWRLRPVFENSLTSEWSETYHFFTGQKRSESTVNIYDENNVVGLGIVRNYYISETSNKYGINSYTSVNGMNLDFTNIDEPIFSFDWRNRFENNIDTISSLQNIFFSEIKPDTTDQTHGYGTIKKNLCLC